MCFVLSTICMIVLFIYLLTTENNDLVIEISTCINKKVFVEHLCFHSFCVKRFPMCNSLEWILIIIYYGDTILTMGRIFHFCHHRLYMNLWIGTGNTLLSKLYFKFKFYQNVHDGVVFIDINNYLNYTCT